MVKMQSAPASRYSELVNEEVKALMARRGFTQVKLAEAVGISQPRVSRMIFKNEFSMPISILERIAQHSATHRLKFSAGPARR